MLKSQNFIFYKRLKVHVTKMDYAHKKMEVKFLQVIISSDLRPTNQPTLFFLNLHVS